MVRRQRRWKWTMPVKGRTTDRPRPAIRRPSLILFFLYYYSRFFLLLLDEAAVELDDAAVGQETDFFSK